MVELDVREGRDTMVELDVWEGRDTMQRQRNRVPGPPPALSPITTPLIVETRWSQLKSRRARMQPRRLSIAGPL